MLALQNRLEYLKQVNLFAEVDEDILIRIVPALKPINLREGDKIITKGEQGDCMYLLVSGAVNVHDGEHKIAEITGKKAFGELSLLNTSPRTASITAAGDCELLRFDQADFYQIMGESTGFRMGMVKLLTDRLQVQNDATIDSLKRREKILSEQVKERTAELEKEKMKMQAAMREIKAKNKDLQQANNQINEQKAEIEEKNKNITASIRYAKRIQEAMLPEYSSIKDVLEDSFVLYKPRDIVSGDFYWFGEKNGKTIIAAADCTGHGVPGAFMSMIGSDLISEAVNMLQITEPDLILNHLHKRIRETLKQDENENRDGMDIGLCSIDFENGYLDFAGAKNPLFYTKNGEIFWIKGDRMPIGGLQREAERLFSRQRVVIDARMNFYLFTDGYQDQFGGPEGTKFMVRRLKDLIHSLTHLPMPDQKLEIYKTLQRWVLYQPEAPQKQIDDILILAFGLGQEFEDKKAPDVAI